MSDFRPSFRQLIPSLATWGHGACGFAACLVAEYSLGWAALLVVCAWMLDLADGALARWLLKGDPDGPVLATYGNGLDAVCDGLSFGVAPLMMVWWGFADQPVLERILVTVASFPFFVAISFRLARFGIVKGGGSWFRGMFSPAAGMVASSGLLLFLATLPQAWAALVTVLWFWFTGYLAVSTIRFPHTKTWYPGGALQHESAAMLLLSIGIGFLIGHFHGWELGATTGYACFWLLFVLSPLYHAAFGWYERIE